MPRTLAVALSLSLVFAGCKAKEAMDEAAIATNLQKEGTVDLLKQTAEDSYTPPEDGRLTDAQVQMYLKVREHEKKIAQVAKEEMKQHAAKAEKSGEKSLSGMMEGLKALGSVADLATADIRAAKQLGINTQEYLWVKQQILAVSTATMAAKATEALSAQMDASYQQMKKAHDEATDATTKKMYADMLAGFEKSKAEAAQQQSEEDPALAHNRQLLSKYENVLNAFATEMAKWSDEKQAGDTQKAVQEFDKAVAEAKKQP